MKQKLSFCERNEAIRSDEIEQDYKSCQDVHIGDWVDVDDRRKDPNYKTRVADGYIPQKAFLKMNVSCGDNDPNTKT